MFGKGLYLLASGAALALLFIDAPTGSLLTTKPTKTAVQAGPTGKTVRGRGPTFIYLGGGYRGGK